LVKFDKVSKIYNNGTVALNSIDIKIEQGEFVFLVGPSGAGKSTLIKLMMNEEKPTSGKVVVNGFHVDALKRKQVPYLRRSIGTVFQDFRLLQNKTVYDNVAFAMQVVESSQKEIRRQVPYILSLVGIGHKSSMLPNELSGGEQQRVSIARALVNKPALLIADEPTGNLDPETANGIMQLIEKINQNGTTVIMATHAKDIVNEMAKRVIAVEKGLIVRDEEKGVYGYEN